jgi:hypothetical protein
MVKVFQYKNLFKVKPSQHTHTHMIYEARAILSYDLSHPNPHTHINENLMLQEHNICQFLLVLMILTIGRM